MKARIYVNLLALLFAIFLTENTYAQPGRGNNAPGRGGEYCNALPNLTEEQEKKIDELKVKHLKEMTSLKNQIALKNAELRILETADKIDKSAIDKKIDELMAIKTQMAKKAALHKQDVRALLTEDQKVIFDMKSHRPHNGNCPQGRGNCEFKPGGPPHQPK